MAFSSPIRQVRSAFLALTLACAPGAMAIAQETGQEEPPAALRQGSYEALAAEASQTPPVPSDGDLTVVDTPEQLRDGVFDRVAPPAPPEDGLDAAQVDSRNEAERSAFEYEPNPGAPPDGDALLFQIEEIAPLDPASNRRPSRFATLEPYDPVGIRIGTFVLFPEAELSLTRYSNVFASPDGEADIAGQLKPSLRLVSNWSNHALEFRAEGDFQNYRKFGSENDRGYLVESRGRLDITRRTNLQAQIGRQSAQESRSAVDATQLGPRATVKTDQFAGSLNQRFNRLSLQLRGGVTDTNYSDSTSDTTGILNGSTSLDDRDETEHKAAIRATWEFKPTFQVFAEYEGNDRNFEAASSADNRRRDSTGLRLRGGINFGDTSERLRGEVALGYASQDLEDARLEDADGVTIDANLAYRFNGLTSFLLTASTDIASVTQTANSGAVLEHRAGIEARHAFRNYLIGSVGIEGTRRDYAGIDVDETEFVTSLGLEYFFNREAVAFTKYEHTVFRSDFAGSNYESDEIRVGLRLRR